MSIVLQMPRGNLETIFPRAMVVAGIRDLIDEKSYERAFSYCRTQRVDMNILYDHKPEQFLANVGLFLDQLKAVAHIDLFLSSLRYVPECKLKIIPPFTNFPLEKKMSQRPCTKTPNAGSSSP